jgi:hypothetical protein
MSDVETACMKRYIQLQLGTVIYLVTFVDRLPGVWRSTIKPGGYNTNTLFMIIVMAFGLQNGQGRYGRNILIAIRMHLSLPFSIKN